MRASAWRCTGEDDHSSSRRRVRLQLDPFDDLSDSTPARAEEKPDGVKSVRLRHRGHRCDHAGRIRAAARSPCLSSGPGNYSTLELDPGGKDQNLGDSETLGQHTIDSLTPAAPLLFDGDRLDRAVDNSNVGTIIAITGNADGLSVDTQVPTVRASDATAFANGELVVARRTTAGAWPERVQREGHRGRQLHVDRQRGDAARRRRRSRSTAPSCGCTRRPARSSATTSRRSTTPATCIDPRADLGRRDGGCRRRTAATSTSIAGKFAIVTAFDSTTTTTGSVQVVVIVDRRWRSVGTPVAAAGVRQRGVRDARRTRAWSCSAIRTAADRRTTGAGAVDLHSIDARRPARSTRRRRRSLTIPNAGREPSVRSRGDDDELQRQADRRRRREQHRLQLLPDRSCTRSGRSCATSARRVSDRSTSRASVRTTVNNSPSSRSRRSRRCSSEIMPAQQRAASVDATSRHDLDAARRPRSASARIRTRSARCRRSARARASSRRCGASRRRASTTGSSARRSTVATSCSARSARAAWASCSPRATR